jgi:magnesium transporter
MNDQVHIENTPRTNLPQQFSHLPTKSAARIATADVPIVSPDAIIADVEALLTKRTKDFETINYVYVVDADQSLKGVLSVKEVFRAPKSKPVRELMVTKLVTVRPTTHRERAALKAIKHSLKAIPIVDKNEHFIGVVSSDAMLDILHTEPIEDALHFVGVDSNHDPIKLLATASAWVHIKKRIPWLAVGLVGGLIAASVIGTFEGLVKEYLVLAAFIPAIMYMADAVGGQTQTIFIRSLAFDHALGIRAYLLRELRVGVSIGLFFSAAIAAVSFIIWQHVGLALTFGISLFLTIQIAVLVAMALPWLLIKLKQDPAIGTGPFATILRDLTSLLIYFGVAHILLSGFVI